MPGIFLKNDRGRDPIHFTWRKCSFLCCMPAWEGAPCSKKTGSRNNLLSVGNTNESVSAAGEAAALGRLGRCRGVFGRGAILQNTGQRHIDIHRLTVTDNR